MICLTGDIHHDSLATNEQIFLSSREPQSSEVRISREYVRLCEKHEVKCTLYTTGRTLAGQWSAFEPIAESPVVEVGGHTYGGLPRSRLSRMLSTMGWRASLSHGDSHGSFAKQRRDAVRMVDIARQRLGHDIVSWRSHGLVRDENTNPILSELGIRYISDEIAWHKHLPEKTGAGLVSHPLNVIMDHDHLYHAHRTTDYVARQQADWPLKDDPTSESYAIEDWADVVERQVNAIEAKGGVATVLMHPICMYVADGFATMRRLLRRFAESHTIWARETGAYVPATKEADHAQ